MKEKGEDERKCLDEVFRHLAWLAERLLQKKGVEPKPLIYDTTYQNEYDAIFNCLQEFGYKYGSNLPQSYPLIYFDAIYVLFNSLVGLYSSGDVPKIERANVKNHMFSCTFIYFTFASAAIKEGNSNGVALAAVNLEQAYTRTVELGAEEIAKDIIGEITRLAVLTGANPDKLKGGTFLNGSVPEYLEKVLINSPYRSNIENEVSESYISIEAEHGNKWEYIKKLGVKMGTNFRFMFDEITGEDYSSEDPRRR